MDDSYEDDFECADDDEEKSPGPRKAGSFSRRAHQQNANSLVRENRDPNSNLAMDHSVISIFVQPIGHPSSSDMGTLELSVPKSDQIISVRKGISNASGVKGNFLLSFDKKGKSLVPDYGTVAGNGIHGGLTLYAVFGSTESSIDADEVTKPGIHRPPKLNASSSKRDHVPAASTDFAEASDLAEQAAEIAKLKKSNAKLREQLVELNHVLDESLADRGENLMSRKPMINTTIENRELQNALKEIEHYKKNLSDMQKRLDCCSVDRILSLENSLREKDMLIRDLRSEIRGLQNVQREQGRALENSGMDQEAYDKSLRQLNDEIIALKQRLAETQTTLRERERVHSVEHEQFVNLQERNRKLSETIRSYNLNPSAYDDLQKIRSAADEKNILVEEMEKNINILRHAKDVDYKKHQRKIRALEVSLEEKESEIESLKNRIAGFEKEIRLSAVLTKETARRKPRKVRPLESHPSSEDTASSTFITNNDVPVSSDSRSTSTTGRSNVESLSSLQSAPTKKTVSKRVSPTKRADSRQKEGPSSAPKATTDSKKKLEKGQRTQASSRSEDVASANDKGSMDQSPSAPGLEKDPHSSSSTSNVIKQDDASPSLPLPASKKISKDAKPVLDKDEDEDYSSDEDVVDDDDSSPLERVVRSASSFKSADSPIPDSLPQSESRLSPSPLESSKNSVSSSKSSSPTLKLENGSSDSVARKSSSLRPPRLVSRK